MQGRQDAYPFPHLFPNPFPNSFGGCSELRIGLRTRLRILGNNWEVSLEEPSADVTEFIVYGIVQSESP